MLNAQGRIQGDLTVWREGEELSPQRRIPVTAPECRGNQKQIPLLGTPFAGESGLELEIAADQLEKLLAHLNQFIIMDDVELVPLGEEQVGEAGSETAIGLTGPLADEVLERVGLPVIASPMAGTSVEWNGWDLTDPARLRRAGAALRILAAVGGTGQVVVVPAHRRSDAGGLRVA